MSVYIDKLFICKPNKKWPWNLACHLTADTIKELHKFAKSIGLRRSWYQPKSKPHYDLTPGKRIRALKAGAINIR